MATSGTIEETTVTEQFELKHYSSSTDPPKSPDLTTKETDSTGTGTVNMPTDVPERKMTRDFVRQLVPKITITAPSTESFPFLRSQSFPMESVPSTGHRSSKWMTWHVLDGTLKMYFWLLNMTIFVVGIVHFGLGLAAYVHVESLLPNFTYSKLHFFEELGLFRSIITILICSGVISIFLSFFGCCSVLHKRKTTLVGLFSVTVAVEFIQVFGLVVCYTMWGSMEGYLQAKLFRVFSTQYDGIANSPNRFSRAIDSMQIDFECCVEVNSFDLKSTKWFKALPPSSNITVPASCCKMADKEKRELENEICPYLVPGQSNPNTGSACVEKLSRLIIDTQTALTFLFILLFVAEILCTAIEFTYLRRNSPRGWQ